MDVKEKLGYRYDRECIQDYNCSKIYEIVSNKLGLKYLSSGTNGLDNIINNYKLDKEYYEKGEGMFNEVFLIIDSDDVNIRLISLECCNNKRELDILFTNFLRSHRIEYINIMLHQRCALDFKNDIINGIEDKYVEKYKGILKCEKFEKYKIKLECAKKSIRKIDILKCTGESA